MKGIEKKIKIAEKRIKELVQAGNFKKLTEQEKQKIGEFYEEKSLNRLETARIIFDESNKRANEYSDYAEVVAAAYYAMYYIVHSFLAYTYRKKLRENTRGVHIITEYIILYYLIKTKKLAKHLYELYLNTLETASQVMNLTDFQKKAYEFAKQYDKTRTAREIFTYKINTSAEAKHARQAITDSEEFISTIRQIMLE